MKKVVLALVLGLTLALAGGSVQGAAGSLGTAAAEAAVKKEESGKSQEKLVAVSTEKVEMVKAGKSVSNSQNTNTVKKEENKKEEDKKKDEKSSDSKNDKKDSSKSEKKAEPKLSDYTITAFETEKVMYASSAVNVRSGPSTDFGRVGSLARGQAITATGQADTGWYEVVYGEAKAFVSGKYLQDEKPAEPAPQPQEAQGQQAVTGVQNVSGVILVGDSRFVQMQANVGENSCVWIAESGKGYKWFNENAVARIDGCVGKGSKILINLGVNDPGNLNNYLELVNAKAAEWVAKGAKVYYASVNPVWENPYVTEEQVEYFNSQMQAGLSGDIAWIDSHSYLNTIGYKLVDGLHYNAETYQNLYAYYMSCL
ncbi:MAG: SH3 domain-containing protein [Lachnospiraceae bacterium]|jgi:hypothetical protein|nr:SH3 domain-containing protein [Lachnospiraceae bacterium]MCI9107159.1 SH3 domain-containing protein [Lachnospiraceae bacterium]MCI9342059.1 SH3 domain-containing protein [Lachnospiraceae bacterium]